MENNKVKYVLKWTNQIDDKFIDDFLYVENMVFGGFTKEIVKRKVINNPYGQSLVTVAYLNDEPIGADAMMRNDVNGLVAFETIDTCVSEKCRGKRVFSTITKKEIDEIKSKHNDAIIYGFPNGNSFPGYVKMGWNVLRLYPSVFLFPTKFDKENPIIIDFDYARWLSQSDRKFYYFKVFKRYYLVLQGRKHFQMVGRIEPKAALQFEREKCPGLIRYSSTKKRFFNDNGYHGSIITFGTDQIKIPYWKYDTLLN